MKKSRLNLSGKELSEFYGHVLVRSKAHSSSFLEHRNIRMEFDQDKPCFPKGRWSAGDRGLIVALNGMRESLSDTRTPSVVQLVTGGKLSRRQVSALRREFEARAKGLHGHPDEFEMAFSQAYLDLLRHLLRAQKTQKKVVNTT